MITEKDIYGALRLIGRGRVADDLLTIWSSKPGMLLEQVDMGRACWWLPMKNSTCSFYTSPFRSTWPPVSCSIVPRTLVHPDCHC